MRFQSAEKKKFWEERQGDFSSASLWPSKQNHPLDEHFNFHYLIRSGCFIALPVWRTSSSQLPRTLILEMPIATVLSNNNDTNILHSPSPTQPFRLIYSLLDDHLAPINTRPSSVMTTQLSFSLSFHLGFARLSNALNL